MPPAADTNGEPLRILVIDDEKLHAEAVAESLERVGYECVIATSGAAGRQADRAGGIRRHPHRPAAWTDMDGLAILRKAKQELPDAEVVVITGHGDVQDRGRGDASRGPPTTCKSRSTWPSCGPWWTRRPNASAWPAPTAS